MAAGGALVSDNMHSPYNVMQPRRTHADASTKMVIQWSSVRRDVQFSWIYLQHYSIERVSVRRSITVRKSIDGTQAHRTMRARCVRSFRERRTTTYSSRALSVLRLRSLHHSTGECLCVVMNDDDNNNTFIVISKTILRKDCCVVTQAPRALHIFARYYHTDYR